MNKWKFAICLSVGLLAGIGVVSDRGYETRIVLADGSMEATSYLSRSSWVKDYAFYYPDRSDEPVEDVVRERRFNLALFGGPNGDGSFAVYYRDASTAERVTSEVASAFKNGKFRVSTERAPVGLVKPLAAIVIATLLSMMLLYARGRRIFACGAVGAAVLFGVSYLMPVVYRSSGVLRSSEKLDVKDLAWQVSQRYFLPLREVRSHLKLREWGTRTFEFTYEDADRFQAQRLAQSVVASAEHRGEVEVLDAPSVAEEPVEARRAEFGGAGFGLGAMIAGLWMAQPRRSSAKV